MLNEKEIYEADVTAEFKELTGKRYKVRLIEGDRLGATGYYPAKMLQEYGPQVFKKGTPMYLDHMTAQEQAHRPFGSVLNYAAELAEDAYYENDGLYADIEVFDNHISTIKALKDKIGISIRARGAVTEEIMEGKRVPVFQNFTLARSADFVVRAGAGGKIVEMVESAIEAESEAASEEQEMENMDELLEAVKGQKEILEQLAAKIDNIGTAEVVTVEEAAKSDEDILEIAESLAASKLDATGRKRVLDLHRANGKPLAELIEAEEAYVAKAVEAAESAAEVVVEGNETEAVETATETKTVRVPSRWATK